MPWKAMDEASGGSAHRRRPKLGPSGWQEVTCEPVDCCESCSLVSLSVAGAAGAHDGACGRHAPQHQRRVAGSAAVLPFFPDQRFCALACSLAARGRMSSSSSEDAVKSTDTAPAGQFPSFSFARRSSGGPCVASLAFFVLLFFTCRAPTAASGAGRACFTELMPL